MDGLEKRTQSILRAIVTEYILTGDPVGSRTVAKMQDVNLSAASVRNIMSDLTEWGYITQPHVSAGRIPTDLGYRFYVNAILEARQPNLTDQPAIEALLNDAGLDIRDVMRQASTVLAELSRQAGIVTATPAQEQTFKAIEFIKISRDRILVVLVSTSGLVQNKMIFDEDDIDQSTLEMYSRMLSDMLKDRDLRQARERIEHELATEKARMDAILARVLNLSHIILSQDTAREIFIEGQTNILVDPEFTDIEKLRLLFTTFEHKSSLLKILDKTLSAKGIQIFIGAEHGLDDIASCAIVAYPLRTEATVMGSIGVIGPKRMNYRAVVPLVDTTARILTRLLRRIIEQAA